MQLPVVNDTTRLSSCLNISTPMNFCVSSSSDWYQLVKSVVSSIRMIRPINKHIVPQIFRRNRAIDGPIPWSPTNTARKNIHRAALWIFQFPGCIYLGSVGSTRCTRWLTVPKEIQQVAQLWQRDRPKLDMFSINVHRYSQNHAQNCIFAPPDGDIMGDICALSKSFKAKRLCSRLSSRECYFYS